MKLEKSEAIVLQTFRARERDKLVVFLTAAHGKKRGWAYGARSLRTRFGATLEPLSKILIGYAERESEEVVRIESVDLIRSLFDVHRNLESSMTATWIAELIDTFAPADEPSELLFRLADRITEGLASGLRPLAVLAWSDVWILKVAGIFPSTRNCISCHAPLGRPMRFDATAGGFVCEGCAERSVPVMANALADSLAALLRLPLDEFARLPLPAEELFELRSIAGGLRRSFLGHELKSHDLLAAVLTS
ncbi:MAG TPA: DNA repair protein RecO [Thermoanaerobaculia bacterium]|nr:DNA repair protein RecO [Thermoanaerobaculia bacterium]